MNLNKMSVRVVGIDEGKIKQHSTNPNFIELPFILEGNPDETWKGICVSEYGNIMPQSKRRMFIAGNSIIIVANVDDDLANHKRIVEQVVRLANKKFLELSQKTKEQEDKIRKETEQNKAKLAEFKERASKLFKKS